MTTRAWEVELMFVVLGTKLAQVPARWSARYRDHVERLKSGDVCDVAKVVRNLSNGDREVPLTAGETRMLDHGRQILVSEVSKVLDIDEETARRRLDEALR